MDSLPASIAVRQKSHCACCPTGPKQGREEGIADNLFFIFLAPAAGFVFSKKKFGACGGLCFFKIFRRLRRACFFSKFVGACGGLCFFLICSAPAAGLFFFKNCRRLRRALFFQFFSAPVAGFVFSKFFGACGGLCFFKIFRRLRRPLFFSKFVGACGGLCFFIKIVRRMRRVLCVQLFRRLRRALVSLSLNYLI